MISIVIPVYNVAYTIKRCIDSIFHSIVADPGKILILIRNASLVCSDSFHCIAFSMIFKRPFIVFDKTSWNVVMRSRLDTLLSKFCMESR